MNKYDPQSIEPKWQQVWADTKLYAAKDHDASREKYYYLVEFPYPSGEGLHVGHVLSYTALDIMARHKRMQGFNVLYPMGWDAFGLPTENYAIKTKQSPQAVTKKNTDRFRSQLQSLGMSFDWDREVNTSDPEYYKWTQWIFLKLFERGLAYQAELAINWCPFEKTGLANEEVVDGKHERCGTPVEKKLLKQWMLKITAYADRLAEDLKGVDYLDRIATQQVNWIGRSEGAEITWALRGITGQADDKHNVTVYTTRPDTIYGATFLVVSPERADSWLKVGWQAGQGVKEYINSALKASELSRQEDTKTKTGVNTGLTAVHPLTGEEIPVWVADYVLGSYGTGAIMAVPAHDARDREFAEAFNLPIKPVVEAVVGIPHGNDHEKDAIVAVLYDPKTKRYLTLDWGPRQANWGGRLFVGGGVEPGETDLAEVAKREIIEETGYTDIKHVKTSDVRVHAYYFSNVKRRHDLAHMAPVLFELQSDARTELTLDEGEKNKFTVKWVDEADILNTINDDGHALVYKLLKGGYDYAGYGPLVNSGEFNGLEGTKAKHAVVEALFKKGAGKGSTKYRLRDWIFSRQHYWGEPIPIIHCPDHGAVAVPADQLPVELPAVTHYETSGTGESPLAAIPEWVNTTCPTCGGPAKRETDTMPNWAGSSWYFLRYTDPHNTKAFASQENLKYWTPVNLYNGGMEHTTLHLLYSRFWHKFLYDEGLVPTSEPYAARRSHGMILGPDGQKMSKSRGNVINPDHVVEKYGADTIRLYEMFMGPFDEVKAWSEDHLGGVSRFIYRVWAWLDEMDTHAMVLPDSVGYQADLGAFATDVDRHMHKTLKKVHEDIGAMHFNTAVSALMELINFLTAARTKQLLLQQNAVELKHRTRRLLVLMLAPFTPHLAEEVWHGLGEEGSVHQAAWPAYDPALIKDDVVTVIVQVNGKLRANVLAPADATDIELTALARADENIARYLADAEVVKTIVVPRKLVNFVVKTS